MGGGSEGEGEGSVHEQESQGVREVILFEGEDFVEDGGGGVLFGGCRGVDRGWIGIAGIGGSIGGDVEVAQVEIVAAREPPS